MNSRAKSQNNSRAKSAAQPSNSTSRNKSPILQQTHPAAIIQRAMLEATITDPAGCNAASTNNWQSGSRSAFVGNGTGTN